VHGHFGSAPCFTVYDTEADSFEIINNSNEHHSHGLCHPMGVLDSAKIDAVLCRGMGVRAVQKLNEAGVKAYRTDAETVEQVIACYRSGSVEEITVEKACTQHQCH
jgi:predicted Fe-Mo cluster-binding NifX family protein